MGENRSFISIWKTVGRDTGDIEKLRLDRRFCGRSQQRKRPSGVQSDTTVVPDVFDFKRLGEKVSKESSFHRILPR